ncbi:AAA family ATPase [Thiorhodococcus mannitoliphagus]|uniref:AAA family ATPase n=1 Tax=Thiorhodococcus mannitoliphagus TaxID=329406 RepID=A0A6P1E168_9GAMM|nr:AAA family ATPase [Thiorhodococcus mannitoliphagus]
MLTSAIGRVSASRGTTAWSTGTTREQSFTGVATGFSALDQMTGGLQPSTITLVGARPSLGKTAFAQSIATQVATQARRPVAFFSLELPREALVRRLLAANAHVGLDRLHADRLSTAERRRVIKARQRLASAPLHIDDTPALTPAHVRARALGLRLKQGDLGLIVLDYLQLMYPSAPLKDHSAALTAESRRAELAGICGELKTVALELAVPVLVLTPLHRHLERRTDKRPVLADLSRSGPIEPHTDLVLFLYRDEVYNPDSPAAGSTEVIVAKTPNGATGTIRLAFRGAYATCENPALDSASGERSAV